VHGDNEGDRGALEHIAQQLEAIAAGVVLSADATVQIRAALRAALEHTGGDLEFEEEIGLDQGTRELEAKLREALKCLARPPDPIT
jgi:hypothetical protein